MYLPIFIDTVARMFVYTRVDNYLDLKDDFFYIIILLVIIYVTVTMNSNQPFPSVIYRVTCIYRRWVKLTGSV